MPTHVAAAHRSSSVTDLPQTVSLVNGETTGARSATLVVTAIFLVTVFPPVTVTVSVALTVWSLAAASRDRTWGKSPTVA